MSNFVYNNTALPSPKTDVIPPNNPTQQWSAADATSVFSALSDIRTILNTVAVSVRAYGVVGDGVTDDTAAIQAAIVANPGRTLYFSKGKYRVTSTIFVANRSNAFVGDFGGRASLNGTEIAFSGTGPCIQIGTDNGHAWDAGDYDGPQDQRFENLWISHSVPDTALVSAGDSALRYKAGAYGIWDWRAGGIVLRNVGIENFEANFVGIQSDINVFEYVQSFYSKFGFYVGPRSDQLTINYMYSFFCDRCITIDRAGQTRISNSQLVFSGTSTTSTIEVRQGSHGVLIEDTWIERSGQGYQGADAQSFVSVGEVAGYGPGGSIAAPGGTPTTSSVQGCAIDNLHCYNILPATASHTKYLASVGKCSSFVLRNPTEYINSSLGNFDALVAIQSAFAPTSTDTQIDISQVLPSLTLAKIYANLGAGTPLVAVNATSVFNAVTLGFDVSASHVIRGAVVQSSPVGTNGWVATNGNAGQTVGTAVMQVRHNGTFDTSGGAQFPVAMLAQAIASRSVGGSTLRNIALQCQAANGQQNWALETTSGDVQLNTSSGAASINRSMLTPMEVVPPQITVSQDNYSPTGMADAMILLINSSGAVNITGFATGVAGRWLLVYNTGAAVITLKNQTTSATANQIVGRGGADTALTINTSVWLYYSPSLAKWLITGDTL